MRGHILMQPWTVTSPCKCRVGKEKEMDEAYKKITSHGSISIPVAMRRELGIEPKDPMTVKQDGGRIIISPYMPRCIFCGSTAAVYEFNGKVICGECGRRIMEKLEGGK